VGYAQESGSGLIDLHTHTLESDGTYSPRELIDEAKSIGLEALAITDHDTFSGYDLAKPMAVEAGLDLVCGIELSTKFKSRSVHLLGYFPVEPPEQKFRDWINELQESRKNRNVKLVERLQALGVDISYEEVRAKGRSLAGRPHFARVLVEKGYVSTMQQAFDEYLDESAKAYVEREEADFGDAVRRVRAAGGIASAAHPIRLAASSLEETIGEMKDLGLGALEVYHSDHKASLVAEYLSLAQRNSLAMTGGSDFHGANKPGIRLGTGARNNLSVPLALLSELRELVLRTHQHPR
jgi:3',5'-nucleoside bisphosphate phosphatase